MAEKQFTLPELQAMTKPQLKELGDSLNLQIKGLSKPEMLKKIIGENDNKTEIDEVKGEELSGMTTPPTQAQSSAKSTSMDNNWQFQLEMKKLELEAKRMLHEQEMARINAGLRNNSGVNSQRADTFRVEHATKLLPKLVSENEIDTYLVTFEKIAQLQKSGIRLFFPALCFIVKLYCCSSSDHRNNF